MALMDDELLTVFEVAQQLRLNPQTIRNMIDRSELKALRVGQRRVRVTRSALDEFLGVRRETSQQPKQPPPADSGCR
jgi:excisionase family DNA binding protein